MRFRRQICLIFFALVAFTAFDRPAFASTTAAFTGDSADNDLQGRWKWGGDGCYWDEWDDGPDQCNPNDPPPPPPGRYKLGSSGCYYDQYDTGPDQCSPDVGRWRLNASGCYWDGGYTGGGANQCSPESGRYKLNDSGCYWDWYDGGANQCSGGSGRYKLNATGCYWDSSDTGANQCAPSSGRYKLNASGCYWEQNDTGTNQCSPANGRYKLNSTGCYWDASDSGANQCSPATGRYKLSPTGCAWDPADTGPNQCTTASGRYKINGSGCYWDATDSGPNQCNPTVGRLKLGPGGCYYDPYDSGPPQCSTTTGRFKLNSTSCYWDPADSGPQQCSPNSGRFKSGPDGCYWDWNDSGPNQCAPGGTPPAPAPAPTPLAHVLRTRADHLTVDGTPRFLLLASYYDALRVPSSADLDADFHYLRGAGIDGIRIFPNWWHYSCSPTGASDDSLFALNGTIRDSAWQAFLRVIDRAAANGLIVDVTFTRETLTNNIADVPIANYIAQVREVAHRLSGGYAHVMFDFQNEFNVGSRLTTADVAALATAVRAEDPLLGPRRVIMASTDGQFGSAALSGQTAHNAGLSLAAIHPGRGTDWYISSSATSEMSSTVAAIGTPRLPVYMQEPMPFSAFESCAASTVDPAPGHARAAAAAAKAAGAAAWTFHTRTTFKMSNGRYRAKLDSLPAERTELEALRASVDAAAWGIQNYTAPPTPNMTVNGTSSGSISLNVNSALSVSVSNGPGNPGDWVGLFRQGADPRQPMDWRFLNGTQSLSSTGQTSANFTFWPWETGTFEVRLYTDRDFLLLKTSVPISVVDPYPSGRWKWTGTKCEWVATDSGPNQCTPAPVPQNRHTMYMGETLNFGARLISGNGRYRFEYNLGGNLVVYRNPPNEAALWDSGTSALNGVLSLQATDGNLVLYTSANSPIWVPTQDDGTVGVAGHYSAVLSMQDDGNLVYYDAGVPIWSTHTAEPPPTTPVPNPTGTSITTYYTTDAIGSVRQLTDKQGVVLARYDYTPFGALTCSAPSGSSACSSLDQREFAGKERDKENGLDYFGARYYANGFGRFVAADSFVDLKEASLDPQRWNRYTYVRNNPLRYTDPDGRWLETLWDVANVALGVKSAYDNFRAGNIGWAIVDSAGVVVDAAAAIVPFVPGGAGTGLKAIRAVDKVDDAVDAAKNGGLAIGRSRDLERLAPGERTLMRPPNNRTPKENWRENAGRLRAEMKRGEPIRDASRGDNDGIFLNAERRLLEDRGWRYDAKLKKYVRPEQ
jgi:RHS repeat-associated protein